MGTSNTVPDFLVVGHITRDMEAGEARPGGTASYAALTASRLGMRAAILTSAAADIDTEQDLPGVQVVNLPSPVTTTFENIYDSDGRRQRIRALGNPIPPAGLPHERRHCPVVLLGNVANEVDSSFASLFPSSLLGISPQGWMRRWDSEGWVSQRYWSGDGVIDKADVVVFSDKDWISGRLPDRWVDGRAILVLTQGEAGAIMVWRGEWFKIPPYPARQVDPTGAGDVFTAAYLVSYYQSGDPFASALFASCAASLSVEAPGLQGVPAREQVQERMSRFPSQEVVPYEKKQFRGSPCLDRYLAE